MNKPGPLAFFSLAAGIMLGYYHAWLAAGMLLCSLFAAGLVYKPYARQIIFYLFILLAGIIYADISINDMPQSLPVRQAAGQTGIVLDFPMVEGEKSTFMLKTGNASAWEKKIRVVCYFKTDISRGDRICVKGIMKAPQPPGNPGEFNYPLYLAHQGIYYNLAVKKPGDLQLISREQGILKWVDAFRARGGKAARQSLPEQEAAILLGMLLGSREGIDENQYDAFQKTGIIHLFSVSGLHVGFLLLLVTWITNLLGLSKRSKFLSGVLILIIYGTMVAWPVCVLRSIIMGAIGLLAYYSGRTNSLLNAMAIAGIISLLINPASLFTISFQLTFLAAWGVVYIFPVLRSLPARKHWLWDLLLLPAAAELSVLPMIAYYFNIFTPASILTNILVAWLSGAAVILGFAAFFLAAFIPWLAALMLYPAGLMIELILWIVSWMQLLPGAYIWVKTPPVWSMLAYFSALIIFLQAVQHHSFRKYSQPAAAVIVLFFMLILIPAGFYNRGELEMHFIDVGQGDAILLKTPQGKFVLIDGGGSSFYDVGKNTLLPYLHRRGIRTLALAVNTHPDVDHLQGLLTLAANMPVKAFGLPADLAGSPDYNALGNITQSRWIPVLPLAAGQEIRLEKGLMIKVLQPAGHQYAKMNNNNQSVVLQVSYGSFSALLTGDIETEAMQSLLADRRLATTVIVKVPHHGSKGSMVKEFYRQVQPRLAVISVGRNNLYGHPWPGTLTMLQEEHIQTLRTDQAGAVIVRSDGQKIWVEPTRKVE